MSAGSRSRPAPSPCITLPRASANTYELNLIDTPGHVDFHYEVSRSLAACEGALLLVDAFQGVQAQTVANAYAAMEGNLEIIPVVNKIDLPVTRVEEILEEIEHVLGLDASGAIKVSAKKGIGIEEVLNAIVERIPHPAGKPDAPLQALVFDSKYDDYRGVVTYLRVMEGSIKLGDKVRFMKAATSHEVIELGQFRPNMVACETLGPGQVGYIITGIKAGTCTSATRSRWPAIPPRKPSPATSIPSRWSSAGCFRSTPPTSKTCAKSSKK
ncbi:MAG: GTP-binding protein [Planctomycetaceae bacterium]